MAEYEPNLPRVPRGGIEMTDELFNAISEISVQYKFKAAKLIKDPKWRNEKLEEVLKIYIINGDHGGAKMVLEVINRKFTEKEYIELINYHMKENNRVEVALIADEALSEIQGIEKTKSSETRLNETGFGDIQ